MIFRINLTLILLLCVTWGRSQSISFEVVSDIEFLDSSGNKLPLSGVGGFNQPQFYNLDINNDGVLDLFVFDRSGDKIVSLIHDGHGGYRYCPEFDHVFPQEVRFTHWVVLKDYNQDNLPDLWFYNVDWNNSISLYRNITKPTDEHVKFEPADMVLRMYNFNDGGVDSNDVYCESVNIPAIEDVDGDGDIDFMSLQSTGYGVTLFLNNTVENNLPLDPPQYEEVDHCWGDFTEVKETNGIIFKRHISCIPNHYRYLKKKKHSGGSALLLLDMDQDSDMDLVMGNAGLDNLNLLVNGKDDFGKKLDTIIASDTLFPSNTRRAEVVSFAAPFYADVDGDKIKDLIVAVNTEDLSYDYHETGNVLYYRNNGLNDKPVFDFKEDEFLVDKMLDMGGYSAPVLWDVDEDGDLDIIAATDGDYGITRGMSDYLNLFENIGTKNNPVYQLTVKDFLGLKRDSIRHLAPCLGDVDGDGKPELLVGRKDGSLSLYDIIGTGKNATSKWISDHTFGISVYESSAPFLFDVDGDQKMDLLVGAGEGSTTGYFRNISATNIPEFVKQTDTFGKVMTGRNWKLDQYYIPDSMKSYDSLILQDLRKRATPYMVDLDQNGNPEFILADDEGYITIFKDVRQSLADSFLQMKDPFVITKGANDRQCYSFDFGRLAKPAFGDINGDGRMDMVVGNRRGGFQIALGTESCTLGEERKNYWSNKLTLYPNPANDQFYFKGINDPQAYLTIMTINGQKIVQQNVDPTQAVDCSYLEKGVFILQLRTHSGMWVGKLMKL